MFRFGDGSFPSIGKIIIRVPTPDQSFMQFTMEVVELQGLPILIVVAIMDN